MTNERYVNPTWKDLIFGEHHQEILNGILSMINNHYSLPKSMTEVQNIINIMDCLYYDRQGKPNPESNQICKKCGVITNINYLTIIHTLPNILIFIFNKANLIPNVKYYIQQQINIDFFVDQKQNKIYDLIGVIFSPYQKKYIALCKSFLNKLWYSYDDENAKLIEQALKLEDELKTLTRTKKIDQLYNSIELDKNGLIGSKYLIEKLSGNKKFDVDEEFEKDGLIKLIETIVEPHS